MNTAEQIEPASLPVTTARPAGRARLIRDIIVFQVKLALDGLRDLVMSPLSIVAGIIGVLFGGNDPGWAYRRLLYLGRDTDRWINLFNAYDRYPQSGAGEATVDGVIGDIEETLRRDYDAGGVTARSRNAAEVGLERLREELQRRR